MRSTRYRLRRARRSRGQQHSWSLSFLFAGWPGPEGFRPFDARHFPNGARTKLAAGVGIAPTSRRLTGGRSTLELPGNGRGGGTCTPVMAGCRPAALAARRHLESGAADGCCPRYGSLRSVLRTPPSAAPSPLRLLLDRQATLLVCPRPRVVRWAGFAPASPASRAGAPLTEPHT